MCSLGFSFFEYIVNYVFLCVSLTLVCPEDVDKNPTRQDPRLFEIFTVNSSFFQGKYKIKADLRDKGNNRRISCLEAEVEIRS